MLPSNMEINSVISKIVADPLQSWKNSLYLTTNECIHNPTFFNYQWLHRKLLPYVRKICAIFWIKYVFDSIMKDDMHYFDNLYHQLTNLSSDIIVMLLPIHICLFTSKYSTYMWIPSVCGWFLYVLSEFAFWCEIKILSFSSNENSARKVRILCWYIFMWNLLGKK